MFGKKLWRGVYDMVWYGVVWCCGMVLSSGVVWYGVVELCGMVWCVV